MKLVDPLSVMQFLGGSLPIHLSMLFYSATILFVVEPKVKCWYGFRGHKAATIFDDVKVMFAAHIICILAMIVKSQCKPSTDGGATCRTFLKFSYIFTYIFALCYIVLEQSQ